MDLRSLTVLLVVGWLAANPAVAVDLEKGKEINGTCAAAALAVHGGAGTINKEQMTPGREKAYRDALEQALHRGHAVLEQCGAALDAVEAAVRVLEDSPLFNVGRGSVFNADGQHEMDSSLMNGSDLRAGAVAGVQNVKNPIGLACRVMDHSNHVLISGMGAFEFAHQQKVVLEDDQYFFDEFRYQQWKEVVGSDTVQLDHTDKEKKSGGHLGKRCLCLPILMLVHGLRSSPEYTCPQNLPCLPLRFLRPQPQHAHPAMTSTWGDDDLRTCVESA